MLCVVGAFHFMLGIKICYYVLFLFLFVGLIVYFRVISCVARNRIQGVGRGANRIGVLSLRVAHFLLSCFSVVDIQYFF